MHPLSKKFIFLFKNSNKMKYFDDFVGIFIVSVFALILLTLAASVMSHFNISTDYLAIPYLVCLGYTIFKLKSWHYTIGLLLPILYFMGIGLLMGSLFEQIK
jgi:hypothetical protein